MSDSLLSCVSDQLRLVTDLLRRAVESNASTVSREYVGLALERILLVQELVGTVSEEFARLQSQNNEYRYEINSASNPPIQTREVRPEPKKGPGSTPGTERNISPDQGIIDSYSDLVVKYGNLRREMALMRGSIESALRHLNDFWVGDDETKNLIAEQLRQAVSKVSSQI